MMMFKNFIKKFALGFSIVFNAVYFLICAGSCAFLFNIREIALNIEISIFIILLLPILFTIYSTKNKNIDKILKFFFAVETPVLLLMLIRLLLLREMTFFYWFLYIGIFLSVIIYIIDLFKENILKERLNNISLLIFEIPVILGVYFCLLSLFFIIPLGAILIQSLSKLNINIHDVIFNISNFRIISLSYLLEEIYAVLLVLFILLIIVLFFITPLTSAIIYIKEFITKYKENPQKKLCAIWAVVYIILFYCSAFHFSDIDITKKIEMTKNAQNYEQLKIVAEKILKDEYIIKNVILDNYLARLRYISDVKDDLIYDFYISANYGEKTSKVMQNIYTKIAYPFFYNKDFYKRNINEQYKILFDEDIQKGEQKTVSNSVNSTFFAKQEAASLLDVNSKDVKVLSKTVEIEQAQAPDTYKVIITEEYLNRALRNKEVYYEFSLPENAAVTRLRLGNNLQYEGEISAKGAARKTYEAQMVVNSDPALIEKNGVRQYTLRVYPVNIYYSKDDIQKMSFEYYTELENGKIPLPVIYQSRNVYYGLGSKYNTYLNGKKIKSNKNDIYVKVKDANPQSTADFANSDKKIALLLDTSYSNKINWKKYINKEFPEIKNNKNIDYYFFNKFLSEKFSSLDKEKQVNFAQTARIDAYCSVKENYDGIIMLTDTSEYDYSLNSTCENNTPLYIVHIDKEHSKKIPPYSIALTNLIYKTKGNVFTDIKSAYEVVISLASEKEGNIQPQIKAMEEVNEILRTKNPEDINTKEQIHKIAQENNIVTNYSSLIALVNSSQKEELKENEKSDDKYDADIQTGEDRNLKAENIAAVPEPEDWIYIFLILIMISIFALRNKWIYLKH